MKKDKFNSLRDEGLEYNPIPVKFDLKTKAETLKTNPDGSTIEDLLMHLTNTLNRIREDLNFVKNRYITPPKKTRMKITKEERKALIKHKLMTKNRRTI